MNVYSLPSFKRGFSGSAVVQNPPTNAGDARNANSIPRSGRSPGMGNGNPLQYSCLENSMDRRAVHRAAESGTRSTTALHNPMLSLTSCLESHPDDSFWIVDIYLFAFDDTLWLKGITNDQYYFVLNIQHLTLFELLIWQSRWVGK